MKARNHVIGIALFSTLAVAGVLVSPDRSVAQSANHGSAPVTIVGPLPLPVVGQPTPAFQPFAHEFSMNFVVPGADRGNYTVPAGKRLVIETVSARGSVSPGEVVDFDLFVTTGGSENVRYVFQPRFIGNFGILDRFETIQSVRIYADPGTVVQSVFQKNSATVVGTSSFAISGHFEDVP